MELRRSSLKQAFHSMYNLGQLLHESFVTIFEDLNLKGKRIEQNEIEIFKRLGIWCKGLNKRILEIEKSKLIDPLGIEFLSSDQCFNLFKLEQGSLPDIVDTMRDFYAKNQKHTLGEIWPLSAEDSSKPSGYYVYGMPWVPLELFNKERLELDTLSNRGNHYWGPLSTLEIQAEAIRFLNLFQSMSHSTQRSRENQFKNLFLRRHKFITGFIIIKENDYRFMVLSGKHRSHVMQFLSKSKVRVRLDPRFHPVIAANREYSDSLESAGIYKQGSIERVVDAIFSKK